MKHVRSLALLGLALAIPAVVVPLLRDKPAPIDASAEPRQGTPATAAAMAPVTPTVDVIVRVQPESASITIDGVAVANPFHARYPRDERPHRVTASADGYETRSESVGFTSDLAIELGLDHKASPSPRKTAAAPPPLPVPPAHAPPPPKHAASSVPAPAIDLPPPQPSSPPRPEVSPQGGHAPLRPISTTNPYGDP